MTKGRPMDVEFFAAPEAWRAWLAANHDRAAEHWVGFRKKSAGLPTITYAEALDEALCYGWIDGVRKSLDATSYTIRFSPRKRGSIWSLVNIKRATELAAEGRLMPPGQRAFAERDEAKAQQYSYEAQTRELDPAYEAEFRANEAAWVFFQAQPAGYTRAAQWWVMSAKQEATRRKRLATLIADSAAGRRIASLTRPTPAAQP
jgi:uncharacterized protein YdeI (YjbR/CyaY-like superfamily)